MKIPKVLYHGTTALRYAMMKHSGKMDSHMQKYYASDKTIDGYLFFTDNVIEAVLYGFNTCLTDLRMNASQLSLVKAYDDFQQSRDCVVLLVRTSPIKDGFEVDPEHYSINQPQTERMRAKLLAEKNYDGLDKLMQAECVWYRYKGDIPYKYIMPYKYTPYSWFARNPSMLDTMNKGIDITKMLDLMEPKNK